MAEAGDDRDDACSAVLPEIVVRTASDGYSLHYRHWKIRSGPPRGWLLVLHGIQSHSGWYEYSGSGFAKAGWDVRIPDRRGSGKNSVARGAACHWERLRQDVRHFLFDIHRERRQWSAPGPVLMAGISWGGKQALQLARDTSSGLAGLSLITPGLFPRIRPGMIDQTRVRMARLLGMQDRPVPIPLGDPALFSSEPQGQQFIRDDPLALHHMKLSLLYASQDLDRIVRRPEGIPVPVQLMLAGNDRIIDNVRTKAFLGQCATRGLETHLYSGAAHTLELEHCRNGFVHDWLHWAEQLPPAANPGPPI